MTKRRRIGRWVAALALLIATAASTWLLVTARGLRLGLELGGSFVPGELNVGRVEGSILGPIHLADVEIVLASVRISIRSLDIDWHPARLLGGELAVQSLRLSGVDVVPLRAAAPSTNRFELPAAIAPPVDVAVENVAVNALSVRAGDEPEPLALDRATFGFRWDQREFLLRDLVLEGSQLTARGDLSFVPRDDYAGRAAFEWDYLPSGYPPLHGVTTVSGSIDELEVVQHLDAPYGVDARVSVSSPLERAALEGTVALQTAAQQLWPDQPVEAISGSVTLSGPTNAVQVSGDLDLRAPTLADSTVSLVSRYDGESLSVETLRIADPATGAEVELAGSVGLGAQLAIDLEGQWSSLQWPLRGPPLASSPGGSLKLSGTPRELRAELAADVAGGSVRGTVQRTNQIFDARLDWQGLSYPQRAPTLTSRTGTLSVEGRPDDYRLDVSIDLLALRETIAGHIRASGRGTRDALELERVDVGTLDGAVRGSASLSWAPVFSLAAMLDFDDLDPAVLFEQWPGRIKGRMDLDIARADGKLTAEAKELELAGTLRGRALEVSARGRWQEPTSGTLDHLDLRIGETSVHAHGTLGSANDFTWSLTSPSLADLAPSLGGRLSAKGELRGAFPWPTIDAEAEGAGLAVGAVEIGSVELAGKLDAAGETRSAIDFTLDDSTIAGHSVARLELHASGTATDHAIMASGTVDDVQASLGLTGALQRLGEPDTEWSFRIEEASAAYPMFEPWTLRAPAIGSLTASAAKLEEMCWQSVGASLCFDGDYANDALAAEYRLTDLPLQYFALYLPLGTAVAGTATASGELTVARDAPPLFSMDLSTSSVWIGANGGDRTGGVAFAPGNVRARWDERLLALDVSLPLEAQDGGIELQATATRDPGDALGGSALAGNLRADFADLGFISALLAGVESTTGHLDADLRLRGTLDRPEFSGRATLAQGTARLLDAGVLLENAEAVLTADGSGTFGFEAGASSGGGNVRASGEIRFDERTPIGHIEIAGSDFAVLDLPVIQAFASPDLKLDFGADRADLSGRIVIPRASITLHETGEGTASVSPDQIIVDAEVPRRQALTQPWFARIGLELGDAVTFDGSGLKGRLEGSLQISETPAEPATGSGELRIVDGTYKAYQQELEIRRGALLFAGGALTKPGLDIEAVRRPVDDILVGARIRGTLEQPQLTLFSEPPMAREEQLSYLVFGRPLERTSTSETSALSRAAMLLGLSGSGMLTDRINRSLGFDEFGIQTQGGEEQTASFVIGRYLAPSLYLSYGIGLFQQTNTLRMRYRITNRWRLETESSSESSGGDVIYHIERGR